VRQRAGIEIREALAFDDHFNAAGFVELRPGRRNPSPRGLKVQIF
jgi:hypothetical protein